jgi:4-hydroxy-tetrahydrodipicolinate synthase
MEPKGIWLPIITPFYNGEVDLQSYERLISHYIQKGISGLIPLGTTGESPTIKEPEFEAIIDKTLAIVDNRLPVFVGVGGNFTEKVLEKIKIVEKYDVDGILSVCPYYNMPDQNGLNRHFLKISEATDFRIIIYNIPYRTGVNLHNDTLIRLSEQDNIIAVKDSCGDIKQSLELLANKPEGFSVLTGEDILFFTCMVNGGDGGIMASAHIKTELFVDIHNIIKNNDHRKALQVWRKIEHIIPLLFEEPNPGPIKYILSKMEMINSSETRLPLTEISDELKVKLSGIHFSV